MLSGILYLEPSNIKGLWLLLLVSVLTLCDKAVITGELRHDGSQQFLLTATRHTETVNVFLDQTDGIAATGSVSMKVSLAGLVIRVTDNDRVYLMSTTVPDIILNILSDTGFSVELIAEIGCDIIHTDLFLKRFVFFKHLYPFISFDLIRLWLSNAAPALVGKVPYRSTSVPKRPWWWYARRKRFCLPYPEP